VVGTELMTLVRVSVVLRGLIEGTDSALLAVITAMMEGWRLTIVLVTAPTVWVMVTVVPAHPPTSASSLRHKKYIISAGSSGSAGLLCIQVQHVMP
jgi:hypothetical protein